MAEVSYDIWMSRLKRARQMRTDWEQEFAVEHLERFYYGKQDLLNADTLNILWMNEFFATVQTQLPTLLPQTASFLVQPKAGRARFDRTDAQIMEKALEAIAQQDDNLYNDSSLALLQAFFRMGVLKVVYDPAMMENPRKGEKIEGPDGEPTGEDEPDEILTDEVYTFEWVDARYMLLPDAGPNMRRWPWIAEEITVLLEDAKNDERFKPSLRRNFVANVTDETVPSHSHEGQEEEERFRYIEIYDKTTQRFYLVAEGQTMMHEFLNSDTAMPKGIEDHPYSLLRFIPITGKYPSPWPKPVTYDWLPLQDQQNVLGNMLSMNARRAARKFLYDNATFPDEEEIDKFTSDEDMQGVMINSMNQPPMMFGDSATNPDVLRGIQYMDTKWRIITGASGARLSDPDSNTATEAVLTEQAATIRESDERGAVQRWISTAGEKMLQLLRQTLTLDLWVTLRDFTDAEFQEFLQREDVQAVLALSVGAQNVPGLIARIQTDEALRRQFMQRYGNIKPLQVTRERLQFEADVEVLPSTSRPIQQAQLLRLAQVLGPVVFTSPTFMEELFDSFDLPQGERIAAELQVSMRRMQEQQAQQGQAGTGQPDVPGGDQQAPAQPNPLQAIRGGLGL